MRWQFTRFSDDEVVVFCEVHHEVERHRLDIAQARIENHAFEVAKDRRADVQRILQARIRPPRPRTETRHHARETLRPVARPKLLSRAGDALNEELGWG